MGVATHPCHARAMDQTSDARQARGEPAAGQRVALVDLLRGLALVAMIAFHFSWDLGFLSLADLDVTSNPLWVASAHVIAGSFLLTVGISLVLAQEAGIRPSRFLRRLIQIVLAAGAVTVASLTVDPDGVILFGVLHCIAVSSILGLFFLRAPVPAIAAAAAACIILPFLWTSPAFNAPGWAWLGLASEPPPADDYIPLLPWFGIVLAGIAIGRQALELRPLEDWAQWRPGDPLTRLLAFGGRHTLIVYLLHQPILLGMLWLFAFWRGGA
jgi:uncharacterized membrane protein